MTLTDNFELTSSDSQEPSRGIDRPPRKDHRAAVQSHKLRMSLLDKSIRFGTAEPAMQPRSPRMLIGSAILGALGIVATIGASALIQFFTR